MDPDLRRLQREVAETNTAEARLRLASALARLGAHEEALLALAPEVGRVEARRAIAALPPSLHASVGSAGAHRDVRVVSSSASIRWVADHAEKLRDVRVSPLAVLVRREAGEAHRLGVLDPESGAARCEWLQPGGSSHWPVELLGEHAFVCEGAGELRRRVESGEACFVAKPVTIAARDVATGKRVRPWKLSGQVCFAGLAAGLLIDEAGSIRAYSLREGPLPPRNRRAPPLWTRDFDGYGRVRLVTASAVVQQQIDDDRGLLRVRALDVGTGTTLFEETFGSRRSWAADESDLPGKPTAGASSEALADGAGLVVVVCAWAGTNAWYDVFAFGPRGERLWTLDDAGVRLVALGREVVTLRRDRAPWLVVAIDRATGERRFELRERDEDLLAVRDALYLVRGDALEVRSARDGSVVASIDLAGLGREPKRLAGALQGRVYVTTGSKVACVG